MMRFLLMALVSLRAFAQVTVQEYALPPRNLAHDVWADAAPDGPVRISFQRGGYLGQLDPKTGKVDLIPLGSGSSPYGVIAGPDGAPWLTDGGQNAIVRVDPKTREVKKWPLPEGTGYTNLNTATFDKAGIHWFTGQSGYYGRLDPASGGIKVFDSPAVPTAFIRRRMARCTSRRWPARTSVGSTRKITKSRSSSRRRATRAHAACGRTRRARSGSRSGIPGSSRATTRQPGNGKRRRRPARP